MVIGAVSFGGIFYRFITKAAARQAAEHYRLDDKIN
jgi:hypothetical protein